jgi:hypothetical protein
MLPQPRHLLDPFGPSGSTLIAFERPDTARSPWSRIPILLGDSQRKVGGTQGGGCVFEESAAGHEATAA